MFLQKFVFINWGNIPAQEFEFGPVSLFSGGNGSGKTTAADAIQAIMTAAHDTLFQFNPGQEEATQRGRGKQVRTLASYVLGCDDGSFARPEPTVGYLAAVFHPTDGESGERFTAVMGLSARLDRHGSVPTARLNDQLFYLVPGEALGLNDFLQTAGTGNGAADLLGSGDLNGAGKPETDTGAGPEQSVVPLNRFVRRLEQRLGGTGVERFDTKKAYLRRLYAALRGRDEPVTEREAMHAARAFARFMAYKPVRSIHDFVAGEILEPRDLGDAIRSVSDLMKTIHAMDSEAGRLHASVERLDHAERQAGHYLNAWLSRQLDTYTLAQARFRRDQTAYINAKQAQSDLHQQHRAQTGERQLLAAQRDTVRQQQIRLEAERLGVPELQSRAEAEQRAEAAEAALTEQVTTLRQAERALSRNRAALNQLAEHESTLTRELQADFPPLDLQPLWAEMAELTDDLATLGDAIAYLTNADWVDDSARDARIRDVLQAENRFSQWLGQWTQPGRPLPALPLRDALARVVDRRQQAVNRQMHEWQQAERDARAESGRQAQYPASVRQALDLLHARLPESRPRVLCDCVQVTDAEWQPVIEAYLGMARFTLLVEPEHETAAARLLREAPAPASRARVAQGEQARKDADRRPAGANSLPALLDVDHPVARAYLDASYGNVECVDSVETLRRTRRGICLEGVGSGGYTLYRCHLPDSDLVLGQGARERAESLRADRLREQKQQCDALQAVADALEAAREAVSQLEPINVSTAARALGDAQRERDQARDALAGVSTEQYRSLDDEQARLDERATTLDDQIRELDAEIGRLEEQQRQCDQLCQSLSDTQEATQQLAEDRAGELEDLHAIWPEFDLESRLDEADQRAAQADTDALEKQVEQGTQSLSQQVRELEQAVADHNQHNHGADAIVFNPDFSQLHSQAFFHQVADLRGELQRQYQRLRHHVLVDKLDQIARLRDSFNDTFVTNLCHAIYHAIDDGKRVLEDLNRELAHHRFGADRERYWFDWDWVPEFQEYWRFFREVTQAPGLGEKQTLFTLPLSEKSARVRDRLLNMLLDSDEDRAHRELARIADYRNYRAYEIYKQPEGKEPLALSRYGTGSGGQLETPAYIIRSAAITSAFQFGQGDTHLRMVLVDEAFSKMDEARSREVIGYLTERLGLQLLFIMPTSKSGPFLDLISHQFVFAKIPLLNGQRIGELQSRVLVDRQQLNRDRIQTLWANHRRVIRQQAELDFMDAFDA